jgi:hypothetical protein
MQVNAAIDGSGAEPEAKAFGALPLSAVPPTPGESAAMSARWQRRGLLGRLVRTAGPVQLVKGERT